MRLAYVDPQSYRGLAKYDIAYLGALIAAGFEGEVRFYCSRLLDQPVPDGVEAVALFNYNRKRNAATKLFSYAFSVMRLLVRALTHPVDVYHFQWFKFPPLDLLVVFMLRRLAGAKVVFTAHNVVPHGAEQGHHRFLGTIYRAVDDIVVHNEKTAEAIAQRFSVDPVRFSVLPHGAICLEANGVTEHEQRVREFVAAHDTCFLFFGHGSRYKGLDMLLEAWPQVRSVSKTNPGLIVMGSVDRELKSLAHGIADESGGSLLLVDAYVSEADLYHAAQACDVVVLPHREISQSGVLLSVLGLGVPVLVAPLPGLLEPFSIAQVGWQFDGTEAGLVVQLTRLADDPQAIAAVRDSEEGWEAVKRAYDWTTIACSGAALYQSLLTSPGTE